MLCQLFRKPFCWTFVGQIIQQISSICTCTSDLCLCTDRGTAQDADSEIELVHDLHSHFLKIVVQFHVFDFMTEILRGFLKF